MKQIPLTQGQFAIVDDEDFEFLSLYNWHARWCPKVNSYYAVSKVSGKKISMHRLILNAEKCYIVDHKNHNTLDNRKENIRKVSPSDNQKNRRMSKNNSSGIIGVSYIKHKCKWHAHMSANGKQMNLGYYDSKDEAISARKEAEKEYGFHINHGIYLPIREREIYKPKKPSGVTFDKERNRWKARIQVSGNVIHLGNFPTQEQALRARQEAEVTYLYQSS